MRALLLLLFGTMVSGKWREMHWHWVGVFWLLQCGYSDTRYHILVLSVRLKPDDAPSHLLKRGSKSREFITHHLIDLNISK